MDMCQRSCWSGPGG